MNRLEEQVKKRGLNVFLPLDHAAGAAKIGKTPRPTELLVLGNPQGGTPFMECAQSVGIDLPLKALVWEDASSQVWLGYNDPAFLAKRHDAEQCPVAGNIQKALKGIAEATIARDWMRLPTGRRRARRAPARRSPRTSSARVASGGENRRMRNGIPAGNHCHNEEVPCLRNALTRSS